MKNVQTDLTDSAAAHVRRSGVKVDRAEVMQALLAGSIMAEKPIIWLDWGPNPKKIIHKEEIVGLTGLSRQLEAVVITAPDTFSPLADKLEPLPPKENGNVELGYVEIDSQTSGALAPGRMLVVGVPAAGDRKSVEMAMIAKFRKRNPETVMLVADLPPTISYEAMTKGVHRLKQTAKQIDGVALVFCEASLIKGLTMESVRPRGSGALEECADLLLYMHPKEKNVQCVIGKNRLGASGESFTIPHL